MALATAMVTVPREPDYIHATLESLKDTGFFESPEMCPLHIIPGSPIVNHLERYRRNAGIEIIPMTAAETSALRWTELSPQSRCALGHYRCLTRMLSLRWRDLLVLEDDIRFARGWMGYLSPIVTALRKQHEKWVLTLYRLHPGAEQAFGIGRKCYSIVRPFWGTQAVVYPREVVVELAEHILLNCLRSFVAPVDDSIGIYCELRGIPMYATAPSLVQHIGKVTTGQSGSFHAAAFFVESVGNLEVLGEVPPGRDPI